MEFLLPLLPLALRDSVLHAGWEPSAPRRQRLSAPGLGPGWPESQCGRLDSLPCLPDALDPRQSLTRKVAEATSQLPGRLARGSPLRGACLPFPWDPRARSEPPVPVAVPAATLACRANGPRRPQAAPRLAGSTWVITRGWGKWGGKRAGVERVTSTALNLREREVAWQFIPSCFYFRSLLPCLSLCFM